MKLLDEGLADFSGQKNIKLYFLLESIQIKLWEYKKCFCIQSNILTSISVAWILLLGTVIIKSTSMKTVAVYSWSIAKHFVLDIYRRCLQILCQIAFSSIANYFRSYRKRQFGLFQTQEYFLNDFLKNRSLWGCDMYLYLRFKKLPCGQNMALHVLSSIK